MKFSKIKSYKTASVWLFVFFNNIGIEVAICDAPINIIATNDTISRLQSNEVLVCTAEELFFFLNDRGNFKSQF